MKIKVEEQSNFRRFLLLSRPGQNNYLIKKGGELFKSSKMGLKILLSLSCCKKSFDIFVDVVVVDFLSSFNFLKNFFCRNVRPCLTKEDIAVPVD